MSTCEDTKSLDSEFTVLISGELAGVCEPRRTRADFQISFSSLSSWSHPQLTTLTNEQIVAELGWTRKLIKDVIGVTTLTFRPPRSSAFVFLVSALESILIVFFAFTIARGRYR